MIMMVTVEVAGEKMVVDQQFDGEMVVEVARGVQELDRGLMLVVVMTQYGDSRHSWAGYVQPAE